MPKILTDFFLSLLHFYFIRYIQKPSDTAATMNVKQNQMVASQVKILKKAVENLKNAYNGKETEDWYAPGEFKIDGKFFDFMY